MSHKTRAMLWVFAGLVFLLMGIRELAGPPPVSQPVVVLSALAALAMAMAARSAYRKHRT